MLKQLIFAGSTLFAVVLFQTPLFSQQSIPIEQVAKYVNLTGATSKYVVTNTNDSGAGSLREAINNANSHAGSDVIVFNIPVSDPNYDAAAGTWRIQPETYLPLLTDDSTSIDGASQAVFVGNDPNPQGPEIILDGSQMTSASDGIDMESSGNAINGLVINSFIYGVSINGTNNIVSGCYLGVNATGTDTVSNIVGIFIAGGSSNVIGGSSSDSSNIISGNRAEGIIIKNATSTRIQRNFIGTDRTGTVDLGNFQQGIHVYSNADSQMIGGSEPGQENVISGNGKDGIHLESSFNTVLGNYIGTDISGMTALPNEGNGITLVSGHDNAIGGTPLLAKNMIVANKARGILISNSNHNVVFKNFVGIKISDTLSLGNQNTGIFIGYGSSDNRIERNLIKENLNGGVYVLGAGSVSNTITQNVITSHKQPGIDNLDGGNTELTPPVIKNITSEAVVGTVPPNATVEIFSDPDDEGEIWEATVTADAAGNFKWLGRPVGPNVTATATGAAGNTSEFSAPLSTLSYVLVTTTSDNGPGSLREAIATVQTTAGMDTIRFHIPDTDANYDASAGVWRIHLQKELPRLTRGGTVIDGHSQAIWYGTDANPGGPEIVLDGRTDGATSRRGIAIQSSRNIIRGLVVQHFDYYGVYIEGDENTICGNFIGTNATGTDTASNNVGVAIVRGSHNLIGGTAPDARNLISGNRQEGITVNGAESDSNRIVGNFIGTDVSGASDLGNDASGIAVFSQPVNTIIGGDTHAAMNVISGNKQYGIALWGNQTTIIGNKIGTDVTGTFPIANEWDGIRVSSGRRNIIGGTHPGEANIIGGNKWRGILVWADSNQVMGNFIGTDSSSTVALGNNIHGIWLAYGAQDNVVGPGNVIANNSSAGVAVGMDSTIHNTITQNSITANLDVGIMLSDGGNQELSPPIISSISASAVTGTAPRNSTVEIFSDPDDEGKRYEGTTTADANGNFQWEGTPAGLYITATATDSSGNTSSFSLPALMTGVALNPETDKPVRFELDQNYPNPFNSTTQIQYSVPKAGIVRVQIFNLLGQVVKVLVNEQQEAGHYTQRWDASALASGIYLLKMEAGDYASVKKCLLLR